MKKDIHPKMKMVKVFCSCGNKLDIESTLENPSLNVEICSACHPFYTGKQKIIDTAGRIERFKNRYK